MKKIRLIIIDDSLMFREFLKRALRNQSGIEVVGVFADPTQAIDQLQTLRPDVLAVDMEMPKMRGDEFLRKVLPKNPNLKAVVISSLSNNVFEAMKAGAIDFVGKPGSEPGYGNEQFVNDFIQKINISASANTRALNGAMRQIGAVQFNGASVGVFSLAGANSKSIIAIGASTGGTEATIEVVKNFPENTPGVVIVQHMPPKFTEIYAQRLDKICKMKVNEAKNGERVEKGKILIAPGGDLQMRVKSDSSGYYVYCSPGQKVSGHCPSVDVLFESVSLAAGKNAVGALLTGMGADGAEGLLKMRRSGAYTIGQDQESCVVYGMPKVAYDIGGVVDQLPLSSIGSAILKKFSK